MADTPVQKLIRQTELDTMLEKIADVTYLQSLSDKDLLKFYSDVNQLRYFYMLMQSVAKELANSVYGGFGTASLRYFLQAVAEDITGEGRRIECRLLLTLRQQHLRQTQAASKTAIRCNDRHDWRTILIKPNSAAEVRQ